MEFRILGSFAVSERGALVPVGGRRQQVLLALLLTRPNEVVPAEALVEALWHDPKPANTLQTVVSRLRRALGDDRIVTRGVGYAVRVEPDELDALTFERLAVEGRSALAAGDVATAAARLADALALWRGAPLADFAYEEFAQAEIARLEERRLVVTEDWIEAELACGRHADVVAVLESLGPAEPLRERLQELRLLALYRAGRPADALARYDELRRSLRDQLGIEPGPALRRLHVAMLQQDPALDVRPPPDADGAVADVAAAASPADDVVRRPVTVAWLELDDLLGADDPPDPERLEADLRRLHADVREIVERHEGRVERLPGYAAVAVFGAPRAHEDDAARAVRAATEVLDAVARAAAASPLACRIGVASGELLDLADALHASSIARTAQHLARVAPVGEMRLDADTTSLAAHAGARPGRALDSTGFVDRDVEFERLLEALDAVDGGAGSRAVTVIGSPGIGKSRIVAEFLGAATPRATIATAHCVSYGDSGSAAALAEIVRAIVGDGDLAARLATFLAGVERAPLIAERIAAAAGAGGRGGSVEEEQWAFRRLLERVAAERPLIVAIDDLQWADPLLLDLVDYVVAFASEAPILFVCTARPELVERHPSWAAPGAIGQLLPLDALPEEHATRLVARLLEGRGAPPEALPRIVERGEGNPLFVEQVVALEVERGFAAGAGLPRTLRGLLQARIDSLGVDERRVLERASIEGRVFHRGGLVALMPPAERDATARSILALMRRGLLAAARPELPGEDALRFRHVLVRDAAYESIAKERRARLHEQLADWLAATAAAADEVVGYHLQRAFAYGRELGREREALDDLGRRATAVLTRAAHQAIARNALPAAASLLRQVAEIAPERSRERAATLVELGDVLLLTGDLHEAGRTLDEARALAEAADAPTERAHADVLATRVALEVDTDRGLAELEPVATRAEATFAAAGDELGLSRTWLLRGMGRWFGGRCSEAGDAWQRAGAHARQGGDDERLQEILGWIASAHLFSALPADDGIERCTELLALTVDNPMRHALIQRPLAFLVGVTGRTDEAHALFADSRRTLDEFPGTLAAVATYHEAELALFEGDAARALAIMTETVARLRDLRERALLGSALAMLAQSLVECGRADAAEAAIEESREIAESGDVLAQMQWRTVSAPLLAARGEHGAALALSDESLAIMAVTDWLIGKGDAYVARAAVLRAAGRPDEADAAVHRAEALYAEKGALLAARRAAASIAVGERQKGP